MAAIQHIGLPGILPSGREELRIAAVNLVPVAGYFLFAWDVAGILLFYAAELALREVLLAPRIVSIAVGTRPPGQGMTQYLTLGIFAWLLHLAVFALALVLVLGLACGATGAGYPRHLIPAFLAESWPVLLLVGGEELFFLWRSFVRGREYAQYGLFGYLRVNFTDTAVLLALVIAAALIVGRLRPAPFVLLLLLVVGKSIAELRLWRRRQLRARRAARDL